MKIPSIVALIVLIFFYFIVPAFVFLFVNDNKKIKQYFSIFILLFFCVLLVGVLADVTIKSSSIKINLTFSGGWFAKNVKLGMQAVKADKIINLFMLIPFGEYIFIKIDKRFCKGILLSLICGIIIGVIIETLQFILPVSRVVQLSDVVFNCVSCVMGFVFMSLIGLIKRLLTYSK